MTIERAFGILTAIWRILAYIVYMFEQRDINDVISACCTLHNICIDREEQNFEVETSPLFNTEQGIQGLRQVLEDDDRRKEIYNQILL